MTDQTEDLITQLFQAQMTHELRRYLGNLTSALHVVENDWLPAEDELVVQPHLETLRRYLAESGRAEEDTFLLRFGLTVPGMQRGIVPPLIVLEENRGGFSVRRQKEAEGQIRRLAEALAIGRRLVANLSSDTQQAVAELASWCERQPVADDEDWLRWFNALDAEQAEKVGMRALDYVDSDEESVKELGTKILWHLACFRRSPLSEACCHALIERHIFWPVSLYRDSGDAVAHRLIAQIAEVGDLVARNHLLLALAWTRSNSAFQAFHQWADDPPIWSSELYVPPAEYLHGAGWCLDVDGQRRDLTSAICYRLLLADEKGKHGILCRVNLDKPCPSCGGSLDWLFDFTQAAPDCFPGEFAEAPRKVLCCLHCAAYGHVFTSYRGDGIATWLWPNEPCEFPYDESWQRSTLVRTLSDTPCAPSACAEPFSMSDASTLGGMPMWLQDSKYPRCIDCGRLMTFLAQHDNSPLGEEGIYYAFFCAPCHVAAVGYQQT